METKTDSQSVEEELMDNFEEKQITTEFPEIIKKGLEEVKKGKTNPRYSINEAEHVRFMNKITGGKYVDHKNPNHLFYAHSHRKEFVQEANKKLKNQSYCKPKFLEDILNSKMTGGVYEHKEGALFLNFEANVFNDKDIVKDLAIFGGNNPGFEKLMLINLMEDHGAVIPAEYNPSNLDFAYNNKENLIESIFSNSPFGKGLNEMVEEYSRTNFSNRKDPTLIQGIFPLLFLKGYEINHEQTIREGLSINQFKRDRAKFSEYMGRDMKWADITDTFVDIINEKVYTYKSQKEPT